MRETVAGARFLRVSVAAWLAVLSGTSAAWSQAWWTETKAGIPVPSVATSLPHNGDWGGKRKRLADLGVIYGFEYTNDVLANVHGGQRVGTIDHGKLQGILAVDFGRLAGWQGLSFFTNFFQLHGTGRIRRDYVGGINTIAAIEATPTTRLSEIWLMQTFADGAASIKLGQIAADTEFFYSEASTMLLQSDWATIAAVNLPSGGAAYPLSTPGVRLKVDPHRDVSLLFAVLNGDPAGPGLGDEQERNRFGLNFRVRDPAFVIGEAQFRRNRGVRDTGLASVLKLGAWGHFGKFDDLRLASDGLGLGNPLSTGVPLQHRGNSGIYAVIDQQLWRPVGGNAESGISVYSRMSASPSDRNLVSTYIDGGLVFAGLVPNRPHDKFGAGAIYSRYAKSARDFDRDVIVFSGTPGVVRDFDANLELSYTAQVVPGWIVQPNVQHIWHPGGDGSRNAVVTGIRSQWRF